MDQLYIVTRVYNWEYILATTYLTQAPNESEAIIRCMEYEGDLDSFIDDNSNEERENQPKYAAELARLRSLSIPELERCKRVDWVILWHAELFTMPTFDENTLAVQIAKLDTD